MGTPIGFFSDDNTNDYPELNKCPDCETYFQALCCPICGKECPEEMRAGNRKAVKPDRKKKRKGNGNGRVQFVPWYYSSWFIVIMLILFPIIGLILLWTSDSGRGWKIAGTVFAVGRYVLAGVLSMLIGTLFLLFDSTHKSDYPDLPREEYIALCEAADPETLFRQPQLYEGKNVSLELTVRGVWNDESDYDYDGDDYPLYYECVVRVNGRELRFLLRDEVREGRLNLAVGDRIQVWGVAEGNRQIRNGTAGSISAPCIRVYFLNLVQEEASSDGGFVFDLADISETNKSGQAVSECFSVN